MKITVRKIEAGEIITEPGFYDMPLNWYHSDCCDGPSVSSSGLRQIVLKSPLHYWDDSYLNPNRNPDDEEIEAEHFRIGRASHFKMLEPERFKANIAVRPEIWDSWRTKDAKAWQRDTKREGFTVMTPSDMERVAGVAAALEQHPWHKDGILGGLVETSMVTKDSKTGIWIKSRPDSIPDDQTFTDLKVCADAHPKTVARAIRDHGYDMQLALAGISMFNLTQQTIDTMWLVCVESKRPHAIHVASLSPTALHWARIKLRKALDVMAECLESGYWPSFGSDGQPYSPTKYEEEELTNHQKAGLLPPDDEF